MKKELTYEEALAYVEENGITLFEVNIDEFIYINSDIADNGVIKLWFGIYNNTLSSFNEDTSNKNLLFNHNFNYEWGYAWKEDYEGTFKIVEEKVEEEGEEVMVWDEEQAKKRIYLCTIPWNTEYKYITVRIGCEEEYRKWNMFYTTKWKNIKKIPKETKTEETAEPIEVTDQNWNEYILTPKK